ncbi:MAG: hypothetical protein LBH50_05085 [Spirochaetaceae bacterium]|jgi:hypothetical protein|nr:hypothetical protein [Spirochaetaceae bacterium]
MKKKRPLAIVFAVLAFFFNFGNGFSQQRTDLKTLSDALNDFSKDITGALPLMATVGLNWPDSYVGQLVDIPPHWGAGITVGLTTLKIDKLNYLLSQLGYRSDDSFASKQLMPAYTIETRVGGLKSLPFDIGLKWGWLPYIPLFNDSINYESCVFGLDFRWELVADRFMFPAISLGFEVDRATGGLRRKGSLTVKSGSDDITVKNGMAGVYWETWAFYLKLTASKRFWEPRLTVYGGLRTGASLTRTGIKFTDGDAISIGGTKLTAMSVNQMNSYQSAFRSIAGNNTTFEVTSDGIAGWRDSVGFSLSIYEGIAFHFYNTSVSLSFITDIAHFEMGANISFIYRQ